MPHAAPDVVIAEVEKKWRRFHDAALRVRLIS